MVCITDYIQLTYYINIWDTFSLNNNIIKLIISCFYKLERFFLPISKKLIFKNNSYCAFDSKWFYNIIYFWIKYYLKRLTVLLLHYRCCAVHVRFITINISMTFILLICAVLPSYCLKSIAICVGDWLEI